MIQNNDISTKNTHKDYDSDDLAYILHRKVSVLNQISLLIVSCTVLNVSSIIILFLDTVMRMGFRLMEVTMSMILLIIILLAVNLFDLKRRSGQAVYEEIVDELQWYAGPKAVDEKGDKSTVAKSDKPPLKIRIAIREFYRSSELPMIPGKSGPLYFFLINLFITAMVAYLYFIISGWNPHY